ncbi:hypothetical protein BJ742DRAFT_775074 [Cladochytrium replicatum]|nr:hypothetical protein BJ742DRAFT_775074 [Cladochytrium replicatum]
MIEGTCPNSAGAESDQGAATTEARREDDTDAARTPPRCITPWHPVAIPSAPKSRRTASSGRVTAQSTNLTALIERMRHDSPEKKKEGLTPFWAAMARASKDHENGMMLPNSFEESDCSNMAKRIKDNENRSEFNAAEQSREEEDLFWSSGDQLERIFALTRASRDEASSPVGGIAASEILGLRGPKVDVDPIPLVRKRRASVTIEDLRSLNNEKAGDTEFVPAQFGNKQLDGHLSPLSNQLTEKKNSSSPSKAKKQSRSAKQKLTRLRRTTLRGVVG